MTVGSLCSGIEAASVSWKPLGLEFKWFSEISAFPSKFLADKYPCVPNLGDMNNVPERIANGEVDAPDIICGGTPCQAFSLSGLKKGLSDHRGQLTLKFLQVIEANDERRTGQKKTIVLWENVEGVLKDKTNAFGCFVSALAGCSDVIKMTRWPNAGLLRGPERNVAWRVIDAKYFGVPQQRKRLYVVAGGKDFKPECVLFEKHIKNFGKLESFPLVFEKEGHEFEVFRGYTDCLYSAYGTKWNGNAAAYNGSLFVVQDGRLRRLSPLECERLMGFPDNYTKTKYGSETNRYQATGNSWAVPVVKWIGSRIVNYSAGRISINEDDFSLCQLVQKIDDGSLLMTFGRNDVAFASEFGINFTEKPEDVISSNIRDIIDVNASEKIYISPVGCMGILRRKTERNVAINPRLEQVLKKISALLDSDEIERISRKQQRGAFSQAFEVKSNAEKIVSYPVYREASEQLTFFEKERIRK